jgi:putative oxidoreductase
MRNNPLFQLHPLNADLAAFLLRLIFGGLFIFHGYQKIENYDMILKMFPDYFGLGPGFSFNMVIFAEFVCGILIVLGLLTRLAALPILITMIVAYFVAHKKDDFTVKELPFLFMLLSLVVFILGSGKYSVDRLIFRKNR